MPKSFEYIGTLQNDTENVYANHKFLFLMQQAILLGLKDLDLLSQVQLYRAEEVLKQQYIDAIQSIEETEAPND